MIVNDMFDSLSDGMAAAARQQLHDNSCLLETPSLCRSIRPKKSEFDPANLSQLGPDSNSGRVPCAVVQ